MIIYKRMCIFGVSSSGGRGEIRTLGTVTHSHP